MNNPLIARYKQLKRSISELEKEQDELKAELLPQVESVGGKLVSDDGTATIIAESRRDSFDTQKLMALMERPEYEWLKEYHKVSQVKAQLRIT